MQRLSAWSAVVGLLLVGFTSQTAHSWCGGLCGYEIGSADNGMAAAGAGARAEDSSTAFWNPAGATRLEGTHVSLGSALAFVDYGFDLGSGTSPEAGRNDGGDLDSFIPFGSAFITTPIYEELKFTFAFNGLYSAGIDYDNAWAGRTLVTDIQTFGLNLQPGIAYPVHENLSIGAAASCMYMELDMDIAASTEVGAPTISLSDADGWGFAAMVGLLFTPWEGTRIGLTYRTPTQFDLSGDVDNPSPFQPNIDIEFDVAQGVNLSLYQQVTPALALLADAAWSDWSTFDSQLLTVSGGPGPGGGAKIPRDFKDTWRIGIGAQYYATETFMVRGGFSYDSSPVDAEDRLPDVPAAEAFRFAVGLQKHLAENISGNVGYTLVWNNNPEIDNVAIPGGVVLDGEYDNSMAHFVVMALNVHF